MSDSNEFLGWIKAAGQAIDVVKSAKALLGSARKAGGEGDDAESINPQLERSIFGDPKGIPKFNNELNSLLRAQARPFLLRVGNKITIPGDEMRQVRAAVARKEVWDWTYVFSSDDLSTPDKEHISRSYFEAPNQPSINVSTSVLKMTQTRLPEDLEAGVVLVGITLDAGDFNELNSMEPTLMIPTRAVICMNADNGGFSVVADPVATRVWLERAIDVVLQHEPQAMLRGGFHARLFFDGIDDTPPIKEGSFAESLKL